MYYIVTGAAGFIGANLVRALNDRGETNVIAVDNLSKADKFKNLVDCEIADYLGKEEFIAKVQSGAFNGRVKAILHEGACSDTMETDGRYMMENNYRYSIALLDFCQREKAQYLYASSASVYGGGSVFKESREYEAPLNVYGYSKFLFDQYVRRMWDERLAMEMERSRRSGTALSVIMIDLDDFKEMNDVGGHDAGDRLLQELARAWLAALRGGSDFLARLGGDEFAVIAPGSDDVGIRSLTNRLNAALPEPITISIGVATWNGTESASDLLRRADHAMYQIKRRRPL